MEKNHHTLATITTFTSTSLTPMSVYEFGVLPNSQMETKMHSGYPLGLHDKFHNSHRSVMYDQNVLVGQSAERPAQSVQV